MTYCPKHDENTDAGCIGCETERLTRNAFEAYPSAPFAEAYLTGVHQTSTNVSESAGAFLAKRPLGLHAEHVAAMRQLLRTQDNRSTADPIYVVERRVRDFGYDPDYCEDRAWIDAENAEDPVTRDLDPGRFAQLEAGEFDGRENMWTKTGYKDRWEFVQPFLTMAAAERYRETEAHNLGESRVYVASGYRNPEWQWLRSLLGGEPR